MNNETINKKPQIALIAVSKEGADLARQLNAKLPDSEMYVLKKYSAENQIPFDDIGVLAKNLWKTHHALIFFCASGIAVRAIASCVSSKYTDPAVVVCGDKGAFIISLLSGHEGGANEMTQTIAHCLNSIPVITTASESSPHILPRNLVVGIGLKRGTSADSIRQFVETIFAEHSLSPLRMYAICSIDIKRDEQGLLEAAETFNVPPQFFSAEYLNTLNGEFSPSDFVRNITGTDNVCERSAAAGCGNKGKMLIPKTAREGITISVFKREAPMALFAFRLVRERVYHYLTFS